MPERAESRGRIEGSYLHITQEKPAILSLLHDAPIYKKNAIVTARFAEHRERIETWVNGVYETSQYANWCDRVITQESGEQYVVPGGIFHSKYEQIDGTDFYRATGFVRAIENPMQERVSWIASWGSFQNGEADCMVAASYSLEKGELGVEPYFIDRRVFEATYLPHEALAQVS